MPMIEVLYHEKPGIENTRETLEVARKRAGELGIRQLVVATTTGKTALDCAGKMPEMEKIVAVMMHAVGHEVVVRRPEGETRAPDPGIVARARSKGVVVYRGVHSLMGSVNSAIQARFGGWTPEQMIAQTYLGISTGTKVAVESVLMAADAGHLNLEEDVIGLGGWRGGADTALVIKPAFSHTFFDLKIREFIAMPRS